MAVSNRRFILPQNLKSFFSDVARVLKGGGLSACAAMLALSFLFYSPHDHSLNTASNQIPFNILGSMGAYIADLFLQIFGEASFYFAVMLFLLGGKIIHDSTFKLKKLAWAYIFIAMIMIGIFLLLQLGAHGGVVGNMMALKLYDFLSYANLTSFIPFISISLLIGIIYLSFFVFNKGHAEIVSGLVVINDRFIDFLLYTGTAIARFMNISHSWAERLQTQRDTFRNKAQKDGDSPQSLYEVATDELSIDKTTHEKLFFNVERPTVNDFKDPQKNNIVGAEKPLVSTDQAFNLPPLDMLDQVDTASLKSTISDEELQEDANLLQNVLLEYGVKGEIENVKPGPVVTMFEFKPAAGIKTARVISLADDIARSMSALSTRIATIPGQNVIGIELPNQRRQTVFIRDLLSSDKFTHNKMGLPIILGKNIAGEPTIADLTKMPHLLVAGTTGSGKSVSVNAMIVSLLFRYSPEECKFIMVDPKMLELSVYDDIPHLLTPVVTDPKKAVVALKWAVKEMENRYRAMSKLGVRNVDGYNARIAEANENEEVLTRRVQTGFDPDTGKPIFETQNLSMEKLPYIVVIVDEMADLMLVAGKEIEAAVQRLAQMARAAGIHLIMATQRPSVDVITGTIKANFPTRISFMVTSKIDSRTILGEQGAEQLLGQGDMLYMAGGGRISRVHGPFVKDSEVERIVQFLKTQGTPEYIDSITEDEDGTFSDTKVAGGDSGDDLYNQAYELIVREGKISTSFIQRHLSIGYNRAAKIVDQLEKNGIISAANHVGKREILINT